MPKKILFLVDSLRVGGGIERVISSYTKMLSRNYMIYILTFRDFKNLYSFKGHYYSLKENIIKKNWIFNLFQIYSLIRIKSIFKMVKKISPDIIISNMYYTDIFIILTKMLFRIKIPLIIAIHTNPKMRFGVFSYLNFILKVLYSSNYVKKIVTVSKELQLILQFNYRIKKKKILTIYNGINLENIQQLSTEKILDYKELFYNNKIFKFITLGHLVELKGHKYLIEAFSKAKDEIYNSKLIIIGNGPIRLKLEALIRKLELENDIILLGFKKNPFKYIAKSDIFVLSSLYEGLPTVLIEALACGIPIISTDCQTGPKEILGKCKYGFLVETKNTEELAKKMILLAKDMEIRKKFSSLSKKRSEFFDLKKTLDQWNKIINDVN